MKNSIIDRNPAGLPALVLAYLGDSVFELYVRQHLIAGGCTKVDGLHKQAVRFVNAATQARILYTLTGTLAEEELAVVKRGRNAKSGSVPRNTSVTDYRHGTAFEALIGYLYLMGKEERIAEIFEIARGIVLSGEGGNNKDES